MSWLGFNIGLGVVIFGINMYNYELSSGYDPDLRSNSLLRIGCLSLIRGCIFGLFGPFSLMFLSNEYRNDNHIQYFIIDPK